MKMRQYTIEELKQILEMHVKWLKNESGGIRADLSGANLSRADLSGANLSRAILSGANLSIADLSEANLPRAILSRADLSSAILSSADLSSAILSRADLSGTNLSGANLSGANLSRANLSRADLSGANLFRAYLSGANLYSADLSGTIHEGTQFFTFQYKKHTVLYAGLDEITIGCHRYTIQHWLDNYKEIGEKEGYKAEEIEAYGSFIKMCETVHKKKITNTKEVKNER